MYIWILVFVRWHKTDGRLSEAETRAFSIALGFFGQIQGFVEIV